jgi:hypothetical protein
VSMFPVKELQDRGLLARTRHKAGLLDALLTYFGAADRGGLGGLGARLDALGATAVRCLQNPRSAVLLALFHSRQSFCGCHLGAPPSA